MLFHVWQGITLKIRLCNDMHQEILIDLLTAFCMAAAHDGGVYKLSQATFLCPNNGDISLEASVDLIK